MSDDKRTPMSPDAVYRIKEATEAKGGDVGPGSLPDKARQAAKKNANAGVESPTGKAGSSAGKAGSCFSDGKSDKDGSSVTVALEN